MWYLHTIEYYSAIKMTLIYNATWMNLENITLEKGNILYGSVCMK